MNQLAHWIDHASDTQDSQLTVSALNLSENLAERDSLSSENRVLLHYYRANAFENQLALAGQRQTWSWDIPHLQNVLLELRRAVRHSAWPILDPFRQCQIYTNLANKLNTIGRPVEALSYWDCAISVIPNFALALANRGYGLQHYAWALYDGGHKILFFLSAHDSFSAALAKDAIFDSPVNVAYEQDFAAIAEKIASNLVSCDRNKA